MFAYVACGVCVCVFWWWVADTEIWPSLASGDWYDMNLTHSQHPPHLISVLCSVAEPSLSHTRTHARTHTLLLFLLSSRSIFIHRFTYACIHSRKRTCAHWINRVPIIKCPPSPSPALCMGVGVSWLDNANTLFITLCTFLLLYRIA